MAYSTVKVTPQILEDTRRVWELTVGADEFASEYGALFDWIGAHINYQSAGGESLVYALVQEGAKVASAFIDVVASGHRGGLTKLLKIIITPQFWNVAEHQNQIVMIYVDAIKGAFDLSSQNNSSTFKIYGRTDPLLSLLHSIRLAIIKDAGVDSNVRVDMEGRWLVVSKI
ncbi:hypothetical protein ACLIIZ_18230 [Azonexus caeni]|jgi:hypothetical protein|uniref:hypothetical protein n=1 Tax=Azonexus caeni TaxID=266126 RepID=UPI003A859C8B